MKTQQVRDFFRKVYADYKVIIISYGLLIILALILFPTQLFQTLSILRPAFIWGIVSQSPSIYLPLLAVVIFFIANKFWMKKFDIRKRGEAIAVILIFTSLSSILLRSVFVYAGLTPEKVIHWSGVFMNADKSIFGVYPAFWLFHHTSFIFERLIVYIYMYLPMIITLWILFLFIYEEGKHLNKFIQQYYMAFAICFPLWIIFASISPAQMYVINMLHQTPPTDIRMLLAEGPPTKFIDDHILKIVSIWTDPGGKNLAISTFPSMHALWGILFAYSVGFIFRKKKYGYIAITLGIIIAVANIIGATYVLEHYVVDLLAGVLIAIVVVKIKFKKEPVQ